MTGETLPQHDIQNHHVPAGAISPPSTELRSKRGNGLFDVCCAVSLPWERMVWLGIKPAT